MADRSKDKLGLHSGLEAGGAPVMWERVVVEALPEIRRVALSGSRVLEVGYGDGLLSCWLCNECEWEVVGLDVRREAERMAKGHAIKCGLSGQIEFLCCGPEETREHDGEYDAVFIKTGLYNSPDIAEYCRWLDWILSVLKPGGVLINFETGRASAFMQLYRRIRGRMYTDHCLYIREVETLYDACFEILYRRY